MDSKRNKNLEKIAREQVMDLTRGKYISARELVDVMSDNIATDVYMERYFEQGFLFMPSQIEELHLKRCEDSGVVNCTCLINNDKSEAIIL